MDTKKGNTVDVTARQVEDQVIKIESRLEKLGCLISELGYRLETVMREPSPIEQSGEPICQLVPLAKNLQDILFSIEAKSVQIEDYINRMEIN